MAFQPPVPDQVNAANSSTSPLVSLAVTGASYSGSSLVLTGAWTGGGSSAYVGLTFYVSGFTSAGVGNNSTNAGFVCTASSAGSITLTVVGGYNGFTGAPTAAQMFIGTSVDATVSPVSSVTMFAISDQASVPYGAMIQWSQDNTNWLDHIQAATATAAESCVVSDKVRARYFRIVYISSATQSYFRLQTLVSYTNTSGTVRDLDTAVWGDDEAQLVRSVGTGAPVAATSAATSSAYRTVAVDFYGNQQVAIGGGAADAFGRLRVAEPVSLFNATFEYDAQPLIMQTLTTLSSTVVKTSGESSLTLSTGTTAIGSTAINQTKAYFRYQPGKSQQIIMTGILGAQKTNVRSEIGYGDASNGVFFRMDGSAGACLVQRSGVPGISVGVIPAISLAAGGTGYAVGDTGTISTGGANATYKVIAVAGGVASYIVLTGGGTGYSTGVGVATATGGAQPGAGTGLTVNVLNETVITQANWNIDTMNGSGNPQTNPSGVSLNLADTQIFQIDMQWLGVGRVRYGFVVNGVWCLAHQIYNANLIAVPYMNTACLPCRAMVTNTGTAASTTTMKQICMAVASEGGATDPISYRFSASNARGGVSVSGTAFIPIISISPILLWNGFASAVSQNRAKISVLGIDVCNSSTAGAQWQLIYNPTLTGASFNPYGLTNSAVNVDIAASETSGGVVVASGFVQGGGHSEVEIDLSNVNLPLTLDITGLIPDIYTLACLSISGTVSINASISWKEER